MDKIEYAKSSFTNVQELIRFIDQKIGAALVVLGIEITAYIEVTKPLQFTCHPTFMGWVALIVSFCFVSLTSIAIYISIIKVIRPRYSNTYTPTDYCAYYFDHIALGSKQQLEGHLNTITDATQLNELSSQLFSVSEIMRKKQNACYSVMNYLLLSLVSIMALILVCKCM